MMLLLAIVTTINFMAVRRCTNSGADDKVYGGAGNDTIIQSGSGTQHYDGGDGTDTYKLDTTTLVAKVLTQS